jgi:chemotaxis protein MotB
MSAARRHKKHHHEEHENHERWLVSGYDMMTLLFAVFVVLFAISSTNISKVKLLEQSLQEAFSGPVFTGGKAMMKTGATSDGTDQAAPQPPLPALSPVQAVTEAMESETPEEQAEKAQAEERGFQDLKKRIDKLAREAGLADKLSTTVTPDGLKIRLVTDGVLFDSGSAVIRSQGRPTLEEIGRIIAREGGHPVKVEGHTDDQPIHTPQYPSNWQLSGARAAAVVQSLGAAGVSGKRMSLAGYAAEHPVAGNATPRGRAQNRRVEIILTRLHGATQSHGGDTP